MKVSGKAHLLEMRNFGSQNSSRAAATLRPEDVDDDDVEEEGGVGATFSEDLWMYTTKQEIEQEKNHLRSERNWSKSLQSEFRSW